MKMMIVLGIMFVLSVQPMMVISSLIFVILLYSLYLFLFLGHFWFSYMVILVMMSGVLVVFTYMMSILPNESFEMSGLVMIIMTIVVFCKFSNFNEFMMESMMGSMKIWGGVTLMVSSFLVVYLLMMMLMVVWVSMMEKGAVRIS